jgi:hypothetical protein
MILSEREPKMESCTVFYSWQSDLPNATNRGFIQKSIEDAVAVIRKDQSIEVEPVVDRDTEGAPGAPSIDETIFEKIDRASIFIGDVSIINTGSTGRPTPNPNVLTELGYAMKALGKKRIILIVNTAFGEIEKLPFDLRQRRAIPYSMPDEALERAPERRKLQGMLEHRLREIFTHFQNEVVPEVPMPTLGEQAITAIESSAANQVALTRRYVQWLCAEAKRLAPNLARNDNDVDDALVEGIEKTEGLVTEFAKVSQCIALMKAKEPAEVVYKAFGWIFESYYLPVGFAGNSFSTQFDFFRFLGHEMFVVFISRLMHEERWEIIADLLNEGIYLANGDRSFGRGAVVPFYYASDVVRLLEYRNNRLKLRNLSLHAHLLHERHKKGELAVLAPIEDFVAADCFLFLRSEFIRSAENATEFWRAWSTQFMRHAPRFLVEAQSSAYATKLLRAIGAENIEAFRSRFAQARNRLAQLFGDRGFYDPFDGFSADSIGSDRFRGSR